MSQSAVERRSTTPSPTRLPEDIPPRSNLAHRTPIAPPDRLYHIILLAICSSVLLVATMLSIRERSDVVLPLLQLPVPELCMMRRMVGIDCPGCGLTRCFISLAHGDLASAWSYNPAGIWLFLIMAFQIPFRSYQLWRINHGQPEIVLPWAPQITFGVLAVGLIAQWALRLAGVTF